MSQLRAAEQPGDPGGRRRGRSDAHLHKVSICLRQRKRLEWRAVMAVKGRSERQGIVDRDNVWGGRGVMGGGGGGDYEWTHLLEQRLKIREWRSRIMPTFL